MAAGHAASIDWKETRSGSQSPQAMKAKLSHCQTKNPPKAGFYMFSRSRPAGRQTQGGWLTGCETVRSPITSELSPDFRTFLTRIGTTEPAVKFFERIEKTYKKGQLAKTGL